MRVPQRALSALLLAVILAFAALTPVGQQFERGFGLSTLYGLRGAVEIPSTALIVRLENRSIEWLRFHGAGIGAVAPRLAECLPPEAREELASLREADDLPRVLHGCLVQSLASRGAALVVFDVLFNRKTIWDDAFAERLAEAGNVLMIERFRADGAVDGANSTLFTRHLPRRGLAEAALGTAMFVLAVSGDRDVLGYATRFASFPDLVNMPMLAASYVPGSGLQEHEPAVRPIWIYGPPDSLPSITLRDVFDESGTSRLPQDLTGRVVFVGVSMPRQTGAVDHFPTPLATPEVPEMPGVEYLASAYLNRANGHDIWQSGPVGIFFTVLLASATVFGIALLLAGRWVVVVIGALAAGYFALSVVAFSEARVILATIIPVFVAAPLAILIAFARRSSAAAMLVSRLVPRQIAARMLNTGEADRGAISSEQATVIFMDLVGSTPLAGALSPERFGAALGKFFDAASVPIGKENGMLIDFTGDGIIAVFSMSVTGPHHAAAAVRAGRAVCENVDAIGPLETREGPTRLRLRLGINTGEIATGDFGARDRYRYGILGEGVNVAARLEQLGKEYSGSTGHTVLISEQTVEEASLPPGAVEDLGPQSIRGKTEPLRVFRLNL